MLVTFGVLGLVKYDPEVMGFRYESPLNSQALFVNSLL